MDEKKRIVNLQILDAVVSLKISDKNEEIVRYAAKKLNDRAKDIKGKNPTLESITLLAYLALEECIGSMNRDKKKIDRFFKRITKFISEKMNQLFTDE
ncbi:MAG: cell division protein ZapA [Paludibacteraceae bacterium]|nr:cell division protein ZapA [Paludibacteraceae bacterium]